MMKNTTPATSKEVDWVELVAQIWNDLAQHDNNPNGAALASALATRLNISAATSTALLAGFQSLLAYAQMEQSQAPSAIEEERLGLKAALEAVRPILQARLQQGLDQADLKPGRISCNLCGQMADSQGRRQRHWLSTVGQLSLKRRYFWCADCEQGQTPSQKQVGLPDSDYTACLEEVTTLMATTVPHQMAVNLVEKLLGVALSPQAAKSSVERRAEHVLRLQQEQAQQIQLFQQQWEKVPPYITTQADGKSIDVAYLELDGVHVLSRTQAPDSPQSTAGRGGPGRKYVVSGREVKNAILYEGKDCAKQSERRGCLLEKTYLSHLGEWQGLAILLWAAMLKRGFDRARLLVVLSDGAEWIRSLCRWLPMPVLLILDLYHVKKKIWDTAAIIYGEGTIAAKAWAEQQCQRVEEGRASEVIEGLEFVKRSHRKAREQINSLQGYLRNNEDRMDYPR